MIRKGTYPAGQPAFPLTLGYQCIGRVVQVGDSVEEAEWGYKVGSRVAVLSTTGCWADFVVAKRDEVFAVPDDIDGAAASALVLNCAFHLVREAAAMVLCLTDACRYDSLSNAD